MEAGHQAPVGTGRLVGRTLEARRAAEPADMVELAGKATVAGKPDTGAKTEAAYTPAAPADVTVAGEVIGAGVTPTHTEVGTVPPPTCCPVVAGAMKGGVVAAVGGRNDPVC
jgi:hypothetical protein